MAYYPGSISNTTNLPNPAGVNTLDSPDHAILHSNENAEIIAIETALGVTAGTSVLKGFNAGDFALRVNANGAYQQVGSAGTLNNFTLNAPAVSAGTYTGGVFTAPTINLGTVNGAILGTPVVKGAFSNGNFAATGTVNWANGDIQYGTITQNTTLVYANQSTWQRLTLLLYENATGNFSITLPASKYPNGLAPIFGTVANNINAIVVVYDGSNNLTQYATSFS